MNNHVDSNNTTSSGIGNCIKNWFFRDTIDLDNGYRNNMLVAATLIVAVTFQTGITPPGGAWQDTKDGHEAGRAILASLHWPFRLLLILNTLAFSMSTQLMLVLVNHEKLYFEVLVATFSMVATYATAVWSLIPDKDDKDVKFRSGCMAALLLYLWRLGYQTYRSLRSSRPS
ncbi:hypothetical protein JRO89_XS01G0006400 [Xanthoceras sorbifolium]|uniref:PGG domain-containing protein n=1 Tax=Xanthoceras sorbifolium TaxID=99658 RepID=A0ABQ8IIE8_9ROSI|nr:hypothetical protein JRO89_XS01G0006400 [Xanthoceras sorbifolium]